MNQLIISSRGYCITKRGIFGSCKEVIQFLSSETAHSSVRIFYLHPLRKTVRYSWKLLVRYFCQTAVSKVKNELAQSVLFAGMTDCCRLYLNQASFIFFASSCLGVCWFAFKKNSAKCQIRDDGPLLNNSFQGDSLVFNLRGRDPLLCFWFRQLCFYRNSHFFVPFFFFF